jgi:hypothetical protein
MQQRGRRLPSGSDAVFAQRTRLPGPQPLGDPGVGHSHPLLKASDLSYRPATFFAPFAAALVFAALSALDGRVIDAACTINPDVAEHKVKFQTVHLDQLHQRPLAQTPPVPRTVCLIQCTGRSSQLA